MNITLNVHESFINKFAKIIKNVEIINYPNHNVVIERLGKLDVKRKSATVTVKILKILF